MEYPDEKLISAQVIKGYEFEDSHPYRSEIVAKKKAYVCPRCNEPVSPHADLICPHCSDHHETWCCKSCDIRIVVMRCDICGELLRHEDGTDGHIIKWSCPKGCQ